MALITEDLIEGRIDKVAIAIDRIRAFEPPEGYYVAFSGGKDSVVILDLVKRAGVKFDAHYNITGIDPPELFYFIRDKHPEVERHIPDMSIWNLIIKKMQPPTRISRYCCQYLKERGGSDRTVITGVRWGESVRRSKRKMTEACFRATRKIYLHPIIDWSSRDVWNYIHCSKLPYCTLYDEGFFRVGCIGCPMGSATQRRMQFDRWPKYEEKWRNAMNLAAEARSNMPREWKDIHPQRVDWSTGEKMFDWWMNEDRTKEDPDQTVMFE
jgi:phosphoadenosine phosphosulfate reductase